MPLYLAECLEGEAIEALVVGSEVLFVDRGGRLLNETREGAPETTIWQYTHGVPDATAVSPDGYPLDNFYSARTGADEVQLDLFGDYKSNVALYPQFQAYFRHHTPPFLAVWGRNDPSSCPPEPKRSSATFSAWEVRFFDTRHFALETHCDQIAAVIRDFLAS